MTRRLEQVRQLVQTLEGAQVVCRQCGDNYGVFVPNRLCTSWRGICDVCSEPGVVTHPRNYGNFRQALDTLREELEAI
jgi:hypothetical protein